jgi:small subunit ribosomal protein S8
MLVAIARILEAEGFVDKVELVDAKPQKTLEVTLKYVDGKPAIQNLKRVSKPGVRQYLGYRDLPRVRQGLGVAIVSTPKGVMTGKQAKTEAVGGELLCIVY